MRDSKFLSWHIQYAELNHEDDCACILGLIWDITADWATADRWVTRQNDWREAHGQRRMENRPSSDEL